MFVHRYLNKKVFEETTGGDTNVAAGVAAAAHAAQAPKTYTPANPDAADFPDDFFNFLQNGENDDAASDGTGSEPSATADPSPAATSPAEPEAGAPADSSGSDPATPPSEAAPTDTTVTETLQGTPTETPTATETRESGEPAVDLEAASRFVQPDQPASAPPQPTQEQIDAFNQRKGQFIGQLAERYAFSPDEATQAVHSPEAVIPKKLAEMHFNILQGVLGAVQSQMGTIVRRESGAISQQQKAADAFYAAYPKLKPFRESHAGQIHKFVQAVVQGAPKGTSGKALMEQAGNALYAMFGVGALPQQSNGGGNGAVQRKASDAPMTPPGTRTSTGNAAPQMNDIEQLNELWDTLD